MNELSRIKVARIWLQDLGGAALAGVLGRSTAVQESPMATVPITPAVPIIPTVTVPAHTKAGFVRFIDAIGHFFSKAEPELLEIAEIARPFLALTPFGPEYVLVEQAIIGIQKTATAALAANAAMTNEQKMGLVLAQTTPALTTILTAKGVTTDTQSHIQNWVQLVFNILAGPVAAAMKAVTPPAPVAGV